MNNSLKNKNIDKYIPIISSKGKLLELTPDQIEENKKDQATIEALNSEITSILKRREDLKKEKEFEKSILTPEAIELEKERKSKLTKAQIEKEIKQKRQNIIDEMDLTKEEDEKINKIKENISTIKQRIESRKPLLTKDEQYELAFKKLELNRKTLKVGSEIEEPKLFINNQQKTQILEDTKYYATSTIQTILSIFLAFFGIIAAIIGLGSTLGFITGSFTFWIALVLCIIVAAIFAIIGIGWFIGGMVTLPFSISKYSQLITYDGGAMFFFRVGTAFLMSWKYLFIKDQMKNIVNTKTLGIKEKLTRDQILKNLI